MVACRRVLEQFQNEKAPGVERSEAPPRSPRVHLRRQAPASGLPPAGQKQASGRQSRSAAECSAGHSVRIAPKALERLAQGAHHVALAADHSGDPGFAPVQGAAEGQFKQIGTRRGCQNQRAFAPEIRDGEHDAVSPLGGEFRARGKQPALQGFHGSDGIDPPPQRVVDSAASKCQKVLIAMHFNQTGGGSWVKYAGSDWILQKNIFRFMAWIKMARICSTGN